jgi:hypothetical protein
LGVTPGVRLEPPALDRLHQRYHVTLLAGLFERRIQILVVLLLCVTSQRAPSLSRREPLGDHKGRTATPCRAVLE